VIVCDPGPDPDDVKVVLIAAHLHKQGVIKVRGIVCNGGGTGEPIKRAALAAAVWSHTGAAAVPIGVGSAGKDYTANPHEYRLAGYDETLCRARKSLAECDKPDNNSSVGLSVCTFEHGASLLQRVVREVDQEDSKLLLQIQAGMTDVADLMRCDPHRVARVVSKCSIMGGLTRTTTSPSPSSSPSPSPSSSSAGATCTCASDWLPDAATNNQFDSDAAAFVYKFCLTRGISMHVVGREAVPPLHMSLASGFAVLCPEDDMMTYLRDAQVEGLVGLWERVCQSQEHREKECESENRGMPTPAVVAPSSTLPSRCTKQWFYGTFCGVDADNYTAHKSELDLETCGTIATRLEGTVKPYDVIALMTLLPGAAEIFDFTKAKVSVLPLATRDGSTDIGTVSPVEHFLFTHKSDAPAMTSVEGLLRRIFELHTGISR